MLKRICISLILAISAGKATAQENYPERAITLISPYHAGGTTETFARLITDDVANILGRPIVIEAKPGAAGTIGARIVANSKPDGYTLLANTSQHIMYDGMYNALSFNPIEDFLPVGILGSAPIIIVTAENSPFKTFKDVLEIAKDTNVTFASGSQGSLPHLTGERVASQAKLNMTHVPFNGAAPALTSVIGGHVDLLYSTAASVMSQIRAGNLRALAVSTKQRMQELPDVPTIAENGLDDFDVTAWYGIWAPKNTPKDIIETLNAAMLKASLSDDVQKRMETFSVRPGSMSPEEFERFVEEEREVWLEVMKNANLQPVN